MANIWEKAISILAGNLNSGLSYLFTTVHKIMQTQFQTHFGPIVSLRGRFSSVFCVKFGLLARRFSQKCVENLSELDICIKFFVHQQFYNKFL